MRRTPNDERRSVGARRSQPMSATGMRRVTVQNVNKSAIAEAPECELPALAVRIDRGMGSLAAGATIEEADIVTHGPRKCRR